MTHTKKPKGNRKPSLRHVTPYAKLEHHYQLEELFGQLRGDDDVVAAAPAPDDDHRVRRKTARGH